MQPCNSPFLFLTKMALSLLKSDLILSSPRAISTAGDYYYFFFKKKHFLSCFHLQKAKERPAFLGDESAVVNWKAAETSAKITRNEIRGRHTTGNHRHGLVAPAQQHLRRPGHEPRASRKAPIYPSCWQEPHQPRARGAMVGLVMLPVVLTLRKGEINPKKSPRIRAARPQPCRVR